MPYLALGDYYMILFAASNQDVAGKNIQKQILQNYAFKEATERFQGNSVYTTEIKGNKIKLITLNVESTHAQNLANLFPKAELIVFISRHSSVSGTPTLSVHTPGNLGPAEIGGIARKVSISPANAMRDVLQAMMKLKIEMHLDYEVSYEGTHHGPSLDVPTMFVELGSSPKQWADLIAAEAVGHAVMEAVSKFGNAPAKAVLGIGGPHYSSKFTCMALENQIAFGHMIPKYAVPNIDTEILKHCVERTLEKVESVILDWKGIKGEDKQPLVAILTEAELSFQKK
jgi:D-aminoacyl-tRNA deacylase